MAALLAFFGLALVISFICSLMESVLLSVRHAHVGILIRQGRRSGTMLRDMKRKVNYPLSAILTLNTVANTVGAAGVGAQAYKVFGQEWVAFSSGMLTLMILVCSEIIPKTLGTVHWKRLAPASAYILRVMIIMTYPVVVVLERISKLFSGRALSDRITREELLVLADVARSEGVLEEKEARIVENLLLMKTIHTGDISTPRAVLVAFQKDRTIGDVVENTVPLRFSRIPLFDEDLDGIVGYVLKTELLEAYYTGRDGEPVSALSQSLHAVPGAKSIADLLDEFIKRREHIFLVVDEYGGTQGIVTLEDTLETLIGEEIVDEYDSVVDMRALAARLWESRRRKGTTL